jgi:hypothetical protein
MSAPFTLPQEQIQFCVRGLEPKDERLFKSFVRLVAHRTAQAWHSCEGTAEVCVSSSPGLQGGARYLIQVVQSEPESEWQIQVPFRASDLETRLNRLGAAILGSRSAPASRPAIPASMRLLRWPPADLVSSAQRMRLATVMTGKVMSLDEVQHRTGAPLEVCTLFIQELVARGCVVPASPAVPATGTATPHRPSQAGLLARIRSRLGLVTGARA